MDYDAFVHNSDDSTLIDMVSVNNKDESGNPLLIMALSPVVLVNGGGGLGKLVLLRLAKKIGFDIGEDNVIRKVRFPLHDHCKKNLGWSNAQVLMRFTLLQLAIMPILLVLLIKIR